MWFVYVIQNSHTKELYYGLTSDMRRRMQEHNAGCGIFTHRINGRWSLAYCECYTSKEDAVLREKRLKCHGRAKQELLKRAANSIKG